MTLGKLQVKAFLSVLILAGLGGCAGRDNGGVSSAFPITGAAPSSAAAGKLAPVSADQAGSIVNPVSESSTGPGTSTANAPGAACAPWAVLPASGDTVAVMPGWASVDAFTVTYQGNGNTGGSVPVDQGRYQSGATVVVKGNTGTLFRTGYSFAGWSILADNSGAAIAPQTKLTMGCANLTLYAQWSAGVSVIDVWGGAQEAIALKSDGSVWTWGADFNGELGDGETDEIGNTQNYVSTYNVALPQKVLGPNGVGDLSEITAIMGGEMHNLALKSDGTVWAWGLNAENQLGDGTTTNRFYPVQVSLLTNIVSLGSRAYHSLAVKADGTVWAWGTNRCGELGNGVADSNYDNFVPNQVQGVSDPIMVTAGYEFSIALLQDHTLVAWGKNNGGQLGDGTTTNRYTPVPVVGISDVAWVSAGWGQAVAVKTDGTVWAWGSNLWGGTYSGCGLLGDGKDCTTEPYRTTPGQVIGLPSGVKAYRAWGADTHTAVLMTDGTVWAFGSNLAGQLGTGSFSAQSLLPVQVQGLGSVVVLTARDFHNQAILTDGLVWSWGSGLSGELGDGNFVNSALPVEVDPY